MARPDSKPKRARKPNQVRKQGPKLNRTRGEETQPDAELLIYDRAIALFDAGRFQGAKDAFDNWRSLVTVTWHTAPSCGFACASRGSRQLDRP